MKNGIVFLVAAMGIVACKGKKKDESKEAWFPVLSYLQSQVKEVDTSLYRLVKVETVDSTSDSTFIPREEFRKYAQDFLSIPDISSGSKKEHYKEDKMYDDVLNNVILTYTAQDSTEEIRREDVMLQPDDAGNSQVKTIIIDRLTNQGNNSIEKNMVW
ncbi:MAG TPA: hypothetical protein VNS32_28675, partial [Flavisolibacter sp.]|nr:hypothetical protein [Flavisolibacter sp.]